MVDRRPARLEFLQLIDYFRLRINMLKPTKKLHVLLLIYGSILCLLYAVTLSYDNDIRQLLERGHAASEYGHFLPYGSAATSGIKSYNPGSLMSYFVGVPMMIWNSPYSALLFIFLLHWIAAVTIKSVLNKEYDSDVSFTYFAVFWCIPWRTLETNLWNPAYMLFFTAIHFYSLEKVFSGSRHIFWFSALSVLSIIGAFQFHPSAVILVATIGLLFLKGAFRPSWKGVFAGILVGLITLIPHAFHRHENPEFYANSGLASGSSFFAGLKMGYPFIKGVLYWFRHGSFMFPSNAMEHTSFLWVEMPELQSLMLILWKGFTYGFAAVTLIFSFFASFWMFKKNKDLFGIKGIDQAKSPSSSFKFTEIYGIAMFFSLGIAAAAMPASFSFWHANLVFPIALIVPILYLSSFLGTHKEFAKNMTKIWLAVFIYFGFFTLFSSIESKYHRYPGDLELKYQELRNKSLEDLDES